MKLHHAGALVVMGWYLIVPPYIGPIVSATCGCHSRSGKSYNASIPGRLAKITSKTCEDYLQEMKDHPEFEGSKR
jgi:cytochrome c553